MEPSPDATATKHQPQSQQMELSPDATAAKHQPQTQQMELSLDRSDSLHSLALLLLVTNVVISVYVRDDLQALLNYFYLLLLFWVQHNLDKLGPEGAPEEKERLETATWLFATTLGFVYASEVTQHFPWPLAVVAWCLAGALSGAYLLILDIEHPSPELSPEEEGKECPSPQRSPEEEV